jgi:hypothetical protein
MPARRRAGWRPVNGLVPYQEPARQKERRLQSGRAGPIFTGFLPHSYGYGTANPARTVLAGATFRVDAFCRIGSWAPAGQAATGPSPHSRADRRPDTSLNRRPQRAASVSSCVTSTKAVPKSRASCK